MNEKIKVLAEGIVVLNDIDKRQHKRTSINWPIEIHSEEKPIDGETRNVSESGILISTKEPLRLNEDYIISLFPPDADVLELHCTVVWSDLYGIDPSNTVYGVGICFVKVSENELHKLESIMPDHI